MCLAVNSSWLGPPVYTYAHVYIWEAQEKTNVGLDASILQKNLYFWCPFLTSPSLIEKLASFSSHSFHWIQGKKALSPEDSPLRTFSSRLPIGELTLYNASQIIVLPRELNEKCFEKSFAKYIL